MITSAANPTVKRLAELHERRGRRQQGLYLLEGVRLVEDALDHGAVPRVVVLAPDLLTTTARGRALQQRLDHQPGLPAPLAVTPALLRHLAATETPSGVVAALPFPPVVQLDRLPSPASLVVVLDGIQDPGNAGTILRTASAAGADAVMALAGSVDLYGPKVVRAAMGAHQRLALLQDADPAGLGAWLAGQGQVLIADAHAPESIYDVDLLPPTVLVVGSEAHGSVHLAALPELRRVAIPMPGDAESLNVAVATAVILFEAVRQRHGAPRAPRQAMV